MDMERQAKIAEMVADLMKSDAIEALTVDLKWGTVRATSGAASAQAWLTSNMVWIVGDPAEPAFAYDTRSTLEATEELLARIGA